jgi:hypothetical protein
MDAATFFAVKDRLWELSAVDAGGINTRKLAARPKGPLARALGGGGSRPDLRDECAVLDMGRYRIRRQATSPKAPSLAPVDTSSGAARAQRRSADGGSSAESEEDEEGALEGLRLYQLLPPTCATTRLQHAAIHACYLPACA